MTAVAPRRRDFDYTEFDQQDVLYCRVSLARNWRDNLIDTPRAGQRVVVLDHKRDARTPRRYVKLAPGKSAMLELSMAEGFFGRFSIPILDRIEAERNENRRKRLAEDFALTRAQSILRWGDSPKPARMANGMTYEALGPARFPDVTVTIIPAEEDESFAKDPRFKPVRLRDLYELGDYWDAEHLVNPGGFLNAKLADEQQAKRDFETATTKEQLAAMQAKLDLLTTLLAANPELMAKANALLASASGSAGQAQAETAVAAGK